MTINLVKEHDLTKGPEAHQVYIFDIQSDSPHDASFPSTFEFEGEKYRAFATYGQVTPKEVEIEGKKIKLPVSRVRAIKQLDEMDWVKNGRKGEFSESVKMDMARHSVN